MKGHTEGKGKGLVKLLKLGHSEWKGLYNMCFKFTDPWISCWIQVNPHGAIVNKKKNLKNERDKRNKKSKTGKQKRPNHGKWDLKWVNIRRRSFKIGKHSVWVGGCYSSH